MGSVGTVALADVWKALDTCLSGYRKQEMKHHWWVYPPDKKAEPYRRVPKGEHGSRQNVRVERGHIRKMSNMFGILACMEARIPGL